MVAGIVFPEISFFLKPVIYRAYVSCDKGEDKWLITSYC
jgi:hypothetical protein